MAHDYSNQELVDMLLIYGEARQNAAAAQRLYAERFPNRHLPLGASFVTLVQRARDTGELRPHRGRGGGPGRPLRILNLEEDVVNMVEDDPSLSTRKIAEEVGTSNRIVWRTLREYQLYPFHIQRVHALEQPDFPRRVDFCNWLLGRHEQQQDFTSKILYTDEAIFTRNGLYNFHNTHQWSIENPHAVRRTNFQRRFSVNVWAGIVNNFLIGPFVLPDRLTGQDYLHFLQNDLPVLLEDVPLDVRQSMWYLHDGAPPHYSRAVRDYLNDEFPDRWIGRGGPVSWPPRSPDLNPLDFFFWGYLKNEVYGDREFDNVEELKIRIEAVSHMIRQRQDVFISVRESLIRRARLCVREGGGNIEHLL